MFLQKVRLKSVVFLQKVRLKNVGGLVFVYYYTCPHCLNSIVNLNQYEGNGVVDKVLALTSVADTNSKKIFLEDFCPTFEIREFPKEDIRKITNQFPVSYYVKDGNIVQSFVGEVTCWAVFKSHLLDTLTQS